MDRDDLATAIRVASVTQADDRLWLRFVLGRDGHLMCVVSGSGQRGAGEMGVLWSVDIYAYEADRIALHGLAVQCSASDISQATKAIDSAEVMLGMRSRDQHDPADPGWLTMESPSHDMGECCPDHGTVWEHRVAVRLLAHGGYPS